MALPFKALKDQAAKKGTFRGTGLKKSGKQQSLTHTYGECNDRTPPNVIHPVRCHHASLRAMQLCILVYVSHLLPKTVGGRGAHNPIFCSRDLP
eukprot:1181097-Prorocentrum_minimum.AAC.3